MTANEQPIIIGLAGYKRAGKTTVAKILVEEHGFTEFTFAGPLKRALLAINPMVVDSAHDAMDHDERLAQLLHRMSEDELKASIWGAEYRRLLEELGQSIRAIDPDFWVKALEDEVHEALDEGVTRIVVSDVCFENELRALWDLPGVLYPVTRDSAAPKGLESEQVMDRVTYSLAHSDAWFDYVIGNSGTLEELREKVRELVEELEAE